jgi:hypothetical protein
MPGKVASFAWILPSRLFPVKDFPGMIRRMMILVVQLGRAFARRYEDLTAQSSDLRGHAALSLRVS